MIFKKSYLTVFILLCVSCNVFAQTTPVDEKVAVLITGWGLPAGYVFEYAWRSHDAARIGDVTEYEGQPCKFGHVGPFPHQAHMLIIPWELSFSTPGGFPVGGSTLYELIFDNHGIYRYDSDADLYISGNPNEPPVFPDTIPPGMLITPLVEVLSQSGELQYGADPRTGEDTLAGWYAIGGGIFHPFSNGIGDLYDASPATYMRYYALMTGPPAETHEAKMPPSSVQAQDAHLEQLLENAFGDSIDVRHGAYNKVTGYSEHHWDVAADFANEGFRKMLLARETTDHNRYANEFFTLNYTKEKLCELGVLNDMQIEQTRQVGRTPEFNTMNVMNLQRFIEAHPEGSTIGIIYATRGLTWAANESGADFKPAHPWSKEVYHENAYLNYLSWKKAVQRAYGDRYDLVFTQGGVDSDLREDNFFTYALGNDVDLQGFGGETIFINTRDAIALAVADGLDKLVVAPCHWNYDNLDTILRMKEINDLPLTPKADLEAGYYDMLHCEDDNNTEIDCTSPDKAVEIAVASSYSNLAQEFATAYYVVLRGTLERFGLYPEGEEPAVEASRMVTKLSGGTVEVTNGASPIAGAKIVIPGDPYPDLPQTFAPDNATAPNDPADTLDCLWEDTEIIIGYQPQPAAMASAVAVGPAVHFGPYRNFFNRDVTVTIPYVSSLVGDNDVKVYIYNHLTTDWDPIDPETVDTINELVTFKTQVLGLFQAGADNVTLIVLDSFTAEAGAGQVTLKWSTKAEIDNTGFNVYRATSKGGPYSIINRELIAAQGSPAEGAAYIFVDETVQNRKAYYYKLEDIDTNGVTTMHGPAKATPRLIKK